MKHTMPNYIPPNEFIDELAAFNPRWQQCYATILETARAAGLEASYWGWLSSSEGRHYAETMRGVPDTLGAQRRARAALDRLMADIAADLGGRAGGNEEGEGVDSREDSCYSDETGDICLIPTERDYV